MSVPATASPATPLNIDPQTAGDCALIRRLTRGLNPRDKARWIWRNTTIRPQFTRQGLFVASISKPGTMRKQDVRFEGMRAVPTCSCEATAKTGCWHREIVDIARRYHTAPPSVSFNEYREARQIAAVA